MLKRKFEKTSGIVQRSNNFVRPTEILEISRVFLPKEVRNVQGTEEFVGAIEKFEKLSIRVFESQLCWMAILGKCPISVTWVGRGYWHTKIIWDKNLEHTECKIFNSTVFFIREDKTEASHQLIKFSQRKYYQHLMHVKKGLKHLYQTDLSFPEGTKIYVNDSLCPYYKWLWNEYKKLWNNKENFSDFVTGWKLCI